MNGPKRLREAGQSIWLDNIRRGLLATGELERYIREYFVTGVTSNPTILQKAISGSADYDQSIRGHLALGRGSAQDLVFVLALEDLTAAADLLRPVYDQTHGVDGYVSVEVSPGLAHDADGTIAGGRALFAEAERPNVLVKVPGTPEGLMAIEELIAAGIPVNVTLLFSARQYLGAAEAYVRGIERRQAAGRPVAVGSVASVFVSRWDAAADARLPRELHGKLGLAVVQQCYAAYRNLLSSDRWVRLAAAGALPQRLLFASTSTKDPGLPDTYYLGRLAAPGTIDTVPEPTLIAFADHGTVCDLLEPDVDHAAAVLGQVEAAGVDPEELAADLQRKGAEAFAESWAELLGCIQDKVGQLAGTPA